MMTASKCSLCLSLFVTAMLLVGSADAQPPRREPTPNDTLISPEVTDGGTVTFRIYAPNAEEVTLGTSDIPGGQPGESNAMTKLENGVWEKKYEGLEPGAYRYNYLIDGVTVQDPKNKATSESNANTWSLAIVSGNEVYDTNKVPHGAVSEVVYWSSVLDKHRRMHVYTPPGYEKGTESYPVFYLLHGAFDSDDSWSTVGRAGFILDNLIAAGKAKPMVVVMPNGHTGPFSFGRGGNLFGSFVEEFEKDIKPYVEANYRLRDGREHRAIAGLSMGGGHTLDISMNNLGQYAYIGVYSSGVFGITGGGFGGGQEGPSWQERHADALDNAELKEGLDLFWFGTGRDDFLVETTEATVKMLREKGFDVEYDETEGAHTWLVWRDYLQQFAPRLFQ